MKKIVSITLTAVILLLMTITFAFAWGTPELRLEATYDEKKQEITVDYYVDKMHGVESADFRLRYNSEALEFMEATPFKGESIFIETAKIPNENKIAVQFIHLYHVSEETVPDGTMKVASLTFKVTDKDISDVVFIATADTCAMDPDSHEIDLNRYTLKLNLAEAASAFNESGDTSPFANENVKKIVIAAVVAFIVLAGGIAVVVIKYRKEPTEA